MSTMPVDLLIPRDVMIAVTRLAAGQVRTLRRQIQRFVKKPSYTTDAAHEARILTRKCGVAARLVNRAVAGIDRRKLRTVLRNLRQVFGPLRQADLLLELYAEYCSRRKSNPAGLHGSLQLHWQQQYRQAKLQVAQLQQECLKCLDVMQVSLERNRNRLLKYRWRKRDNRWFTRQLERWQNRSQEMGTVDLELHRYRIKTKQFRYLCQFLNEPLQQERGWQQHHRELEKLQDLLGGYRDMVQAVSWLEQFEQGLAVRGNPDQHLLSQCRGWKRHCEQVLRRHAKAIEAWRKVVKVRQ